MTIKSQEQQEVDSQKRGNPFEIFQKRRQDHWNDIARTSDSRKSWGKYYHHRLAEIYKFLVVPGQRILELGCGQGDLLSSLEPVYGLGVDFSEEMITRAIRLHPGLNFSVADAQTFDINETFDIVILSDLVNEIWDVQKIFEKIRKVCSPRTRIIINSYSHLWEPLLGLAEKLHLAHPSLYQNWLTVEDLTNLLYLSGFDVIRHWPEIIWPIETPLIDRFLNRILAKLWPFKTLALTNFILAYPRAERIEEPPVVSVVIPVRNEAGNILNIFDRVPQMGQYTELIFVEGHSTDHTFETVEQEISCHPNLHCRLLRQNGKGKGDAVRLGFTEASGGLLMILDGDLTVPPEDLPRFYEAAVSRKGEFINGTRLVYPMEENAMRFLNLLGNKFFSVAFAWLIGQPIKDTLCGTKVLWKKDYEAISAYRFYFGDFDPFGDFDLLFGAAKLGLKIIDLPIRYRQRIYGTTNIQRWKHGLLLLRMVSFASKRLKFI